MQVVILAGGLGTRLSEETILTPKPMVTIGELPIILHIMKWYSKFGHQDFVIALGYKGELVKDYFVNFHYRNRDIRVQMKDNSIHFRSEDDSLNWTVDLIDTGRDSQTAQRLHRLSSALDDRFLLTYGDGLSNVRIDELISNHLASKKTATVTAVRPPARFGSLQIEQGRVLSFSEKNPQHEGWINGGFFVFEKKVLDFVPQENISLESTPMENLVNSNELNAFVHSGFWQGMDTIRDRDVLQEIWKKGNAPWKP